MVKPRKQPRLQRKTLLAVGEGKADAAFLVHLRKLYCTDRNGVNVTGNSGRMTLLNRKCFCFATGLTAIQ
jgi:hypothetical protein